MDGCETMEVWLSLRLDGMLEPEEERELETHLAVCPSCRALAEELEAVHTAFPQLEDCPAPEGFAESVMERIGALEEKKPKMVPLFRRPQVRALMGLAACAVLCIGLYRGGMFTQEADLAAETENVGAGVDAAMYQGAEDRSAAGQDAEAAPMDPASREMPDADGTDQTGDASQKDGLTAIQPQDGGPDTQFQTTAQVPESYVVAGQTVSAVLTLDRLPQGWEDVLGGTPQWLTDEAGRTCCILTADQLQQLEDLARQQGMNASLEGRAAEELPCALVLLETP